METFDEVLNSALKAFNRYQVAKNLLEDGGKAYAEDYINQFSKKDILDMSDIHILISTKGIKEVRQMVSKNAG